MARPDYCPVGNEPCQSMCDEPCNLKGTKQRAQDTALIRQLVEALGRCRFDSLNMSIADMNACATAAKAGRARLKETP